VTDDVVADDAGAEEPDAGLPVTVVIARRPAPGRDEELAAWADEIVAAAARFPGHLGAEIYPPSPPERDELVVAFSFASAGELSAWEHSAERQELVARSRRLTLGAPTTHAVSGFEGIFAHAPGQAVVPPPRWKTATVIALAIYPMSLLVSWLIGPRIADWPIALRVLFTTLLVVPYMSWLGVPYLSRWLRGWLSAGS